VEGKGGTNRRRHPKLIKRPLRLLIGAHYLSLELRALAFGAEYRSETGRMDTALRSLLPGLTAFWRSDVSNTRGENLYETLISIAGVMNWRHVEVLVHGRRTR